MPAMVSLAIVLGAVSAAAQPGLSAEGCAATPDAAVLAALGRPQADSARAVYRVRDMIVDPLLGRTFLQVEQCEHPERPTVLLPFVAARQQSSTAGQRTSAPSVPSAGPNRTAPAMQVAKGPAAAVIRSGQVVTVAVAGAHSRMLLAGRLLANAAVGDEVDVELASLTGEAGPGGPSSTRMHGRLTSGDRVEVQP